MYPPLEAASKLVPIEVKGTNRLRVRDARHVELFLKEYPDRASAGVLLYGGDDVHALTDRVFAIPWHPMI